MAAMGPISMERMKGYRRSHSYGHCIVRRRMHREGTTLGYGRKGSSTTTERADEDNGIAGKTRRNEDVEICKVSTLQLA
jgi:hypothetical protein